MAHRNRTLMMVVSLIWIVAILGTLISAQARSGDDEHGEDDSHEHSSVMLVEALPVPASNQSVAIDLSAPGGPPA